MQWVAPLCSKHWMPPGTVQHEVFAYLDFNPWDTANGSPIPLWLNGNAQKHTEFHIIHLTQAFHNWTTVRG